ncbi:MAG: nitric oxide reductase D protein, partial [Rhodobacteraceae bacterium]|nr:nitric oxide reductase D protein [Paracoccaceae bacterium]
MGHEIEIEPWEPEETVGKLWHRYASRLDAPDVHDGARVGLSEVGGRLAILFRGLGGNPAVEIKPVADEVSQHRLSLRRRLGTWAEAVPQASYDGAALRLPESLAVFPARKANAALYVWLVAIASQAPIADDMPDDPLQADLTALWHVMQMVEATLEAAPGFKGLYRDLCGASLSLRPTPTLPLWESAVEAVIRRMLGDEARLNDRERVLFEAIKTGKVEYFTAPRGYRPFRPVALWPVLREMERSEATAVETCATEGTPEEGEGNTAKRAKRRKADQIERNDSFILHKFEAILSFAEFVNLNRRIEEDDNDDAKKAADDQDEIGLGQMSRAPATKLKLHLDLAPEDVDRETLSESHTYPEWDVRTGRYMPAHARVLARRADACGDIPAFRNDPRSVARINAVRRRFEALRPGRLSTV